MFFIIHPDVPNAPSGVRLSDIKSRSLEVSWVGQHDGNSMVLNYIVEYSNLPGIVPLFLPFSLILIYDGPSQITIKQSLCVCTVWPLLGWVKLNRSVDPMNPMIHFLTNKSLVTK